MKSKLVYVLLFSVILFTIPGFMNHTSAKDFEAEKAYSDHNHTTRSGDQSIHSPGIQFLGGVLVRYENSGISIKHDIQIVDWDGIEPDGSSHQLVITYPDGVTKTISSSFSEFGDYWGNYWISDPVAAFEDIKPGPYSYQVIDSAGNASVIITDVLEPELLGVVDENGIIYTNQAENGTSPEFAWNKPSDNTAYYNVRVYDAQGKRMYNGYTSDNKHKVPPGVLSENSDYFLQVRSFNNHLWLDIDNQAVSSQTPFRTGTISQKPYIDLTIWQGIKTWNSSRYGVHLSPWIEVYDAQGVPGNISYAKVIFPDGKERPLYYVTPYSDVDAEYGTDYFGAMPEGEYTFVVMDKDGNSMTQIENFSGSYLEAIDPASLRPLQDDIITGDTVDFSWQTVEGAKVYSLVVYDEDGNNYISRRVIHPENAISLASALFRPGKRYSYRLRAMSDFEENGYMHQSAPDWMMFNRTFTVSPIKTGNHAPVIDLNGWGVSQLHTSKPDGSGSMFALEFYIKVTDEDGVREGIKEVRVRNSIFGEEVLYLLDVIDDSSATYYAIRFYDRFEDIPSGVFTFEATDNEGNIVTLDDELSVVKVGIPAGVVPAEAATVSPMPSFSWSSSENATFYRVRIYEGWLSTLLWSDVLTETGYRVPEENRLDSENNSQDIFQYRVYAYHENPDDGDIDNYAITMVQGGMMPYFFISKDGQEDFSVDMGSVVTGGNEMKLSVLLDSTQMPHDAWIILFTPNESGEPFGGTYLVDANGMLTPDDGYSYSSFALNNTDRIQMDIWQSFDPCSLSGTVSGINHFEGRWGVYWLSAPSHPELSGNADKLITAISEETPLQYQWFNVICR